MGMRAKDGLIRPFKSTNAAHSIYCKPGRAQILLAIPERYVSQGHNQGRNAMKMLGDDRLTSR